MRVTWAHLVACVLAVSGCNSMMVSIGCDPACPSGSNCVGSTCMAMAAPPDMAVIVTPPDLAPLGCVPACAGAKPFCDAERVCVGCLGNADCPFGTQCRNTLCVAGCSSDDRCRSDGGAGSACCAGGCVDTASDPYNCGACGKVCAFANASSSCVAGTCGFGACKAGYGDCNMSATDGCETSLRVDTNNCGACGKTCTMKNGVAGCDDTGCYLRACTFGFDDCNMDSSDGCETSVLSDVRSCGGCGNDCNPMPHGKASCSLALCQVASCDQGYRDCNGLEKDGCETPVLSDANNCGACNNKCGQGLVCKGGGCTCPNCAIPNASAKCINFVCLFDKCNPGYADCDGQQKNGCETDLTGDVNNCGACGMVCPNNLPFCVDSVCVPTPPCQGWMYNGGCWYTTDLNQSCSNFCMAHGGFDAVHDVHMGNPVCVHYWPQKANGNNWVAQECCSTDNNTNWGATGAAADPNFSHAACHVACPCNN